MTAKWKQIETYLKKLKKEDAPTVSIAKGGVDFNPTSGQLTFTPNNGMLSFPVTILEDNAAEGLEDFLLQLTTSEQRVTLDPAQMIVEITDQDGKSCKCVYL